MFPSGSDINHFPLNAEVTNAWNLPPHPHTFFECVTVVVKQHSVGKVRKLIDLQLDTTLICSSHLPLSQLLFLKMPSGRILWGSLTEILHAFLISTILAVCPIQRNPLSFTIATVLSELYNNEVSRYVIFKLLVLASLHIDIFSQYFIFKHSWFVSFKYVWPRITASVV
jgi:hypothetical protein